MLPGKSCNFRNFFFRNNIIFHNSHLFLPSTYTLVLINIPRLNIFLLFSQPSPPPPPPPPLSPPPPSAPYSTPFSLPISLFHRNFFEFVFFSFTLTDVHTCKIFSNLVNFPYFSSCLGLVLYSEVRQTQF